MKTFEPIRRLQVYRCLSDAREVLVGEMAQNRTGVYFQYDADYIARYASLSPFKLAFNHSLQLAAAQPHQGLHGVFADSLPDGWGTLLMDRVFRQQGGLPQQLTAMDRLSYVGDSGMGALRYRPIWDRADGHATTQTDLARLGRSAQSVFDGQTDRVLAQLAAVGSSGGARPKALVYAAASLGTPLNASTPISTIQRAADRAWLVKFTSEHFPLGHDESRCEAAYLCLAALAGIEIPESCLLPVPAALSTSNPNRVWLAQQRFDCTPTGGREHLHSACGLLAADFRAPSLDYEALIKLAQQLYQSPAAGQAVFRRAMFNLFALNQDDHSKNWAFLQNDLGDWRLAPFYDVTFSPNAYDEHMTSFAGYGKQPPLKAIQKLAKHANFAQWSAAQQVIAQVLEALSQWPTVAQQFGVQATNIRMIDAQLKRVYQDNRGLLV